MNDPTNMSDLPYYYDVYRYFCILVDSDTAYDLTQEVYLRWWQYGRYLEGDHLKSWIILTRRHVAIDYFRKHRPELIDPDVEPYWSDDDKQPDPRSIVEKQEMIRRILSSLKQCDNRTQEIFKLRFYVGLTYKQIGAIYEISASTVIRIIKCKIDEFREEFQEMEQKMEVFD